MVEPPPEPTGANRTDKPRSSDTSSQEAHEHYALLHAQMQRNFAQMQRNLDINFEKATGFKVPQDLNSHLDNRKIDDNDELECNDSSDDGGDHTRVTKTQQEFHNDSSSTDTDEELPPEADPDKHSDGVPVLNGKSGTSGANNKAAIATNSAGKLVIGNSRHTRPHIPLPDVLIPQVPLKTKNRRDGAIRGLPNYPSIGRFLGDPLGHDGSPPSYGHRSVTDGGEDGEEGEKKPRVRASKLEYKRLDELYNKSIHDFYLAESSSSPHSKEDRWEEFIFIVRRRFDYQNKHQKTFVDIKSVELRTVLREILKNVNVVGLREEKPSMDPHLLFNYLPQIEESLAKAKSAAENPDSTLISHLTVLVDYITSDYASVAKRLYPLLEHHEITFDLLWALFLPNTLVYTVCAGSNEPRCLKLDWGEQKESMDRGKFFQMEAHYVDYDGKSFGQANALLEIDEFYGTRRIDSLGVFPLAYHGEEEHIRDKLINRGRKFGSLKGMHYKFYKGQAFLKKKREIMRLNIHGRVMIDPVTFRRINPNYRMSPVKEGSPAYTPSSILGDDDSEDDDDPDGDRCFGGREEDDYDDINIHSLSGTKEKSSKATGRWGIGRKPQRSYMVTAEGKIKLIGSPIMTPEERLALLKKAQQKEKDEESGYRKDSLIPEEMTDEELLLCSPTVLGFSFSDKTWAEFAVSHISEIEFNPEAFDSLVLPEKQKTIVRALVESHSGKEGRKIGIDDVIKGKGKGLVAVLHGRPGVGKTLTAEGISEYLKRPLYMVGAGDLGTDARTLETQLSRILDIAHVWGAVLLLDEADVFLERRSVHELQRNALVSIFLRLLEYFQGILFLTTNRVETFDEAFQSRIHIALRYNDLDKKAKRVIWKTFLGMVAREEVSIAEDDDVERGKAKVARTPRQLVTDAELELLSRRNLNGRQIKNVVRTSQALAASMHEDLALKHLDLVLGVTEGFEHDLKGTGQLDSMMSYA